MEQRDEPLVCCSGQSCRAPLRSGWLGSAWSPLPWEMTVPGRFFLVHPSKLHRSLWKAPVGHLAQRAGHTSWPDVCCNSIQPGRVEVPLYQYREKTHEDDCLRSSTRARSCLCHISFCWRRIHGQNKGRLRQGWRDLERLDQHVQVEDVVSLIEIEPRRLVGAFFEILGT
jgi:hypothetical protein